MTNDCLYRHVCPSLRPSALKILPLPSPLSLTTNLPGFLPHSFASWIQLAQTFRTPRVPGREGGAGAPNLGEVNATASACVPGRLGRARKSYLSSDFIIRTPARKNDWCVLGGRDEGSTHTLVIQLAKLSSRSSVCTALVSGLPSGRACARGRATTVRVACFVTGRPFQWNFSRISSTSRSGQSP